jgi:hypothetical protein
VAERANVPAFVTSGVFRELMVKLAAVLPLSNLSVFKFVKLLSTSTLVRGEPLPKRVTILAIGEHP